MTVVASKFRVRAGVYKYGNLRYLPFLFLLLLLLPSASFSQNATIVGTVTDPSGAVMPNVNVTVTNTGTGWSHIFPTNDAGQYVAPDIQIGKYKVRAEASGFKTQEQKDIVLQVGDRLRFDFQMKVGSSTETITVEANAIAVQADSGEISNVVTGEQMSQISTNGRSIYVLAALTPGTSSTISGILNVPVGGDSNISFNGLRQGHNLYLLDGGENADRGGAGSSSLAPSTDAIAEFRTLTSNYSADYGLASAGTVTMVLKSGSSTFHASAWEFNRNDAFDARNFFFPAAVRPQVQELRLNIFGFNVAGPVTFGKLYNPEKKKTFFFYNMEWRRYVQGGNTNQTVPDTKTYGGNFSSVSTPINVPSASQVAPSVLFTNCPGGVAPAGIVQGSPFPGNVIPSCLINKNATSLLNAGIFPAPNNNITNGIGAFVGGANTPTNLREEIVRIDHNFNSKFSIFGHFVAEQITQGYATSQWSGDNLPTVGDTFGNPSYAGVVHTTYTINPALINEVAFNYNGNRINIVPFASTGLKSLSLPTDYNSTNSRLFTGPNNLNRIPDINLVGQSGANFQISSWPWHNKADDYQIRDDLSWVKAAHQLKFGGSWALYKKVQDLFGQTQGGFTFNGVYSGDSFADYLLGVPSSYQELAVQDNGSWNNVSWATYVQDNWRVNNRLTVNLGLRWDGVPHTYEANNRLANFYPSLYNPAQAATFNSNNTICSASDVAAGDPNCAAVSPGLGSSPNSILKGVPLYLNGIGIPEKDGVPKGLVDNHWAAFAPRLGFAYDLMGNGKTVIRGGFGINYERIQGNDVYNAGPNIPFSLQVNVNGVEFTNPSRALTTGSSASLPINAASITGLARSEYKLPSSSQYSLGIQHQLTSKTVLSLAYVGNTSRHQNDYRNINLPTESQLPGLVASNAPYQTAPGLPFRGFTNIVLSTNEANSHYNALQTEIKSQLKNLYLGASYTYSRSIDSAASTGTSAQDLGTVSNPYAGWKYDVGPSNFDRTHIFLANFIYDIPLFRHSASRLVKTAFGDWQVSGIATIESGLPLNIALSGNQAGNFVSGANRPDLVGKISYPETVLTGKQNNQQIQYFDPTAFIEPAVGAWGNLGHNALRGPGRDNWDMSVFKNFWFNQERGSRLELRLETFNTFNHTQFQNLDLTLRDSRFGQYTSAYTARNLQLGAKLYF